MFVCVRGRCCLCVCVLFVIDCATLYGLVVVWCWCLRVCVFVGDSFGTCVRVIVCVCACVLMRVYVLL